MFIWTDEIVKKCKELNEQGLSFHAIAAQIGGGLTRNMVIGKLRRLGVPKKPLPEKKPGEVPAERQARTRDKIVTIKTAPVPKAMAPMRIPAAPIIAGPPVHLLDLEPHHCRAVLDKRGADDLALYCGAPKTVGSSYCETHTVLFTNPQK